MSSKTYTAQELREMADFFDRNAEMVRRKVLSNAILANIHEVIPMLRQAADMIEREAKGCPSLKANDGVTRYYDCRGRLIREEVRNDGV